MKCAVIIYHKNALTMYNPDWIKQCKESLKNQSFQDFDVFELDYGERNTRLFGDIKGTYNFFDIAFPNHIHAMNFLISICFKHGYDVVFNTNVDDWYHFQRFEKQLEAIKEGYQLVSSNFYYADTTEEKEIVVTKEMNMVAFGDIGEQLRNDHNVIAHPCVAMHSSFWDKELRYNDLIGYEDLDLWQRAHYAGKKFHILEEYLLYYRIHDKQITKRHKGK